MAKRRVGPRRHASRRRFQVRTACACDGVFTLRGNPEIIRFCNCADHTEGLQVRISRSVPAGKALTIAPAAGEDGFRVYKLSRVTDSSASAGERVVGSPIEVTKANLRIYEHDGTHADHTDVIAQQPVDDFAPARSP